MSTRNEIAPIPVGQLGLNASEDTAKLEPGHLVRARNLSYASGALEKEAGADKYNSSALVDAGGDAVTIKHGFDWWPDGNTQRMIVFTSEGKLLRDDGGGTFSTELASGLDGTVDAPWFVAGGLESSGKNRKLFFMTGVDDVQVLSGDGATTSALANPPTDWTTAPPICGVIHDDRFWGAGNSNDPHRLYYSTTADHEDFTSDDAGSIPVYPGYGRKISAIVSVRGMLVVFKDPRGIFIVDTTSTADPDPTNWRTDRLSETVGCVNPHLMADVDNVLLFLDHVANLWQIAGGAETGGFNIRPVMPDREIAVFMRKETAWDDAARTGRMIWYPNKRELHMAVAAFGSTVNDLDVALDFNGQVQRFRVNDRDVMASAFTRIEDGLERPAFGDDDGFVWLMDRDARDKDGAGYEAEFKTPPMDLSHIDPALASIDKNGQFLEIVMQPAGDWTVEVDIIWDDAVIETKSINVGQGGATLGTFELGATRLGGNAVATVKVPITGSGRRFALAVRNSGAGENFSLSRFYLHYTRGRTQ